MLCCRKQFAWACLLSLSVLGCRPAEPQVVLPTNTTTEPLESEKVEAAEASPPATPEEVEAAEVVAEPVERTSPPPDPQKLLVLGDRQPLLIDVYLWIDDRPFDEALKSLCEKVIGMADTDGDGISTWDELAANPRFNRGQFGSLSFSNPQERDRLIKLYDVNRNGRVDPDEAPRLLTRNRGKAREFSVDPRAYSTFRRSREQSDVLRTLDQDGDQWLSADEIEAAADRLQARDADADGIVSAAELAPPRSPMMMMSSGDNWRGELGVYVLDENTSWPEVLRSLETIYNFGSAIEVAALFGADSPLKMIDEDGDGYLEYREIPRIAQLPASATLEIRFGVRAEGQPFFALSAAPEARCTLQETEFADSKALVDGSGRLVIHAADDINSGSSDFVGPTSARAQSLLQAYDQDQNEYLDKDEFPENVIDRLGFEAVDADEDGKLTLEELADALVNVDLVKSCQVRVQRTGIVDPLFAVLDGNGDGRLATRELRSALERLQKLDADGDGTVSLDEFPAFGGLAIYRGGDRDGSRLPPRSDQPPVEGRPEWHLGMDFNGDGDVSWAEFLGNQAQFEELDRDGDGLLSVVEAGTKSI